MAKFQFKGVDEYVAKLKKLTGDPRETIGVAIYAGADIVANRVRAEIGGLPVGNEYARNGQKISTITAAQKAGLLAGFGIARMRQDGTAYNVKLGFEGYNSQKTKNFPSGQPNAMIARSIVAGTSFRNRNDFVRRAANSVRGAAEKAMEAKLDEAINRIMN